MTSPALTHASVIFNVDTPINGSVPTKVSNLLPAMIATFENAGSNTVTLTLDVTNLVSGEYVAFWAFNYNGDATGLTFSPLNASGPLDSVTTSSTQDLDGGNQLKAGLFNIVLNLHTDNSGDRLNGGETLLVTITGTGITEGDFALKSIDKPKPNPSDGGWYTAAEIRGIPGTSGTTSGSIGGNTISAVPEPASVVLLGLGGLVLGGATWARRRKA